MVPSVLRQGWSKEWDEWYEVTDRKVSVHDDAGTIFDLDAAEALLVEKARIDEAALRAEAL
jgi:hypothetical protein